jgi:prepilin-type N-terminal cleavage/methylation domain-containing protein
VKCNSRKRAFTLIEILVAMTMVVIIVAMIYGSYFTTTKSAGLHKARMLLSRSGRELICQMALQISCAYGPRVAGLPSPAKLASGLAGPTHHNVAGFFDGDAAEPDGEILRLITSKRFFSHRREISNGLFEVAYRLDRNHGLLFLRHADYVGPAESHDVQRDNWMPIAQNIEDLQLQFFDGRHWLDKWDYNQKGALPEAVRIALTCQDENKSRIGYETVAHVCCSNSRNTQLNLAR